MELNKVYNMDCMEGIKLLDDNSIDLVLIDPPYLLNLNNAILLSFFKENLSMQRSKEIGSEFWLDYYPKDIASVSQETLVLSGRTALDIIIKDIIRCTKSNKCLKNKSVSSYRVFYGGI